MQKKDIISLEKLLNKEFNIPSYQRTYEWNKEIVYTLLNDINNNFIKNEPINLGSIIIYKNEDKYDLVDGQQRLITLSLLLKFLNYNNKLKLLDNKIICASNTEQIIVNNYKAIEEFITSLTEAENLDTEKFINYLCNDVLFYLIEAKDEKETFQLFDGRNSKFKNLTPVDLLKAYHLGALPQNYPKDKKIKLLKEWDANINSEFTIDKNTNKIEYLYNNILFNIYNWSINKKIKPFTKNDIYLYKGYKSENKYSYIKYYSDSSQKYFQINKLFKAGEGFFNYTNYYIKMLDDLIKYNNLFKELDIDNIYYPNFQFINYLYYGALLTFYDKFGKNIKCFYKKFIEDFIYNYSILHRIKNKSVNFTTVNYYVLNTKYNFFFECNNALNVEELLKLEIEDKGNEPSKSEKLGEMRSKLWKKLK